VSALDPERSSDGVLNDAWEHAKVAIALISDVGRLVAGNDAFCVLSGYAPGELTETHVGDQLAAGEEDAVLFHDLLSGEQQAGMVGLRRKDGTVARLDIVAIETRAASLPYRIVLCWDPRRRPRWPELD